MDPHPLFPHLLSPLQIGAVSMRNRVVVTAHLSNFSDRAGHATEVHEAYYRERAAGGAGLLITEGLVVHPTALSITLHARIDHDGAVEPWQRVTSAVHDEGALMFAQLNHIGRQASAERAIPSPWSSSAESAIAGDVPHVMTPGDIDTIVDAFAAAAARAERSGFDGVEVHAGHGYLIGQFLSPVLNTRDDDYGGSLGARCRILLEILEAIDDRVSGDMVRGMRLTADEFVPSGIDVHMAAEIVETVTNRARVDYVSITEGSHLFPEAIVADMEFERGAFRHLARSVRHAIDDPPPIFTVGRINNPDLAEEILAAGDADAIGMTRAHIADPHLVRKASSGRQGEIRLCIACNQGCIGGIGAGGPMRCLQNPGAGRELSFGGEWPRRSPASRRLLVVGGGPAGLEAAWVAAARGHRVTLIEQSDTLGGQVKLYQSVESRREFSEVTSFRLRMLDKFGVEVITGASVDEAALRDLAPDRVLVATGSEAFVPANLTSDVGGAVWTPAEALSGSTSPGRAVIFDVEGHAQAITVAEHLAMEGWAVTIVVPGDGIAARMPGFSRVTALKRMARLGVRMESRLRALRREPDALVLEDVWSREERCLDADAVVAVGYRRARDHLVGVAERLGCEATVIGDALSPRLMHHAIRDGHDAAWAVS